MIYIVLPQAIRNVMPPLATNVVELAKLTSLGSVVALEEASQCPYRPDNHHNPTPLIAAAVL